MWEVSQVFEWMLSHSETLSYGFLWLLALSQKTLRAFKDRIQDFNRTFCGILNPPKLQMILDFGRGCKASACKRDCSNASLKLCAYQICTSYVCSIANRISQVSFQWCLFAAAFLSSKSYLCFSLLMRSAGTSPQAVPCTKKVMVIMNC